MRRKMIYLTTQLYQTHMHLMSNQIQRPYSSFVLFPRCLYHRPQFGFLRISTFSFSPDLIPMCSGKKNYDSIQWLLLLCRLPQKPACGRESLRDQEKHGRRSLSFQRSCTRSEESWRSSSSNFWYISVFFKEHLIFISQRTNFEFQVFQQPTLQLASR